MDTRDKIESLINKKEIKMKSRMIFILKRISILLVIVATSLLTFFLIGFISFKLRTQGLWMFPRLGMGRFFSNLPWGIILIVIGLIIVVALLTKRFNYKKPLVYSLFIVLIIVFLGGVVVDSMGVHDTLQRKGFYKERFLNDVHQGIIKDYMDNEFKLNGSRVKMMPYTQIIKIRELKNDIEIMVIGDKIDNIIEAQLISKKPGFRRMK